MKKLIIFSSIFLFACNTPYSSSKFKKILKNAKLQAPTSKFDPLYSVKYGEFKDICHKYFYLQDRKYMSFFMCEKKDAHKRSELRIKKEFKVSSDKNHYLKARIKILPLNEEKEFTFLQIHPDANYENTPNKPLLRIAWRKDYNNLKDHLWAIIRLSPNESNYLKIDLGKRPKDFFNISIEVKNSSIDIALNGIKKVKNLDISDWNNYYNYFKAGVYLQGKGCAKVLFDKLKVK